MRCLGEAADLVGESEEHLLICELNSFDLKINKSKLVRPREVFPCHALLQELLNLLLSSSFMTPFGMLPQRPP